MEKYAYAFDIAPEKPALVPGVWLHRRAQVLRIVGEVVSRKVDIQEIKDARARREAAQAELDRADFAFEAMSKAEHEHEWERPEEGGPLMCTCNASWAEEGEEGCA